MSKSNNGGALIGMAQVAIMFMPPEARLALARQMIGYFLEIEKGALAALGGVEPSDDPPAPATSGEQRFECRKCGPLTPSDIDDNGECKQCGRFARLVVDGEIE